MKKIKRIILILAIFLCFYGCEKNPIEEGSLQSKELTVDQAKAFVDAQRLNQFTLKGGGLQKQTIGVRADWSKSKSNKNEKISVVETEIQAMGGFGFATAESIDAWKASSNQAYLYSMSRLVVVKQKKTGEMYSFIMSIVGDKQYFEGKHFKIYDNTYLKRDKDLTGLVLFHNLSGEFVNGWIYCDGQITHSIIRSENLDLNLTLKSAVMMVAIYSWVVECEYWITIGSVDGQLVSYSYRETCRDIMVVTGFYEIGDSGGTSGAGGTPGGYSQPSPCNCINKCPVCGKCLDSINLKSGNLPGDSTSTTTDACEKCTCPPKVIDPNLPCAGDPIKCPSIASSGASGEAGGMFGCVRIGASLQCNNLKKYHDGIDIECSVNQSVYSMYSGVVIDKNDSFSPGEYAINSYGNYITIRCTRPDGVSFDVKYNHLNSVGLNNGATITAGQIVGKSGDTGNAAADDIRPHVHIQIFENNTSIDPCGYFATSFAPNGTISNPCN